MFQQQDIILMGVLILSLWIAAILARKMISAKISKNLGVEEYLLMSRGETKDKGRARQYLLANAFEAIVGAIYLDQDKKGYAAAKEFIERVVVVHLPEIIEKKLYLDPKSRFQEEAQERVGITPSYRVMEESGPDHDKKFVVGVYLGDELIAKGEGQSKQEGQRQAAQLALEIKSW